MAHILDTDFDPFKQCFVDNSEVEFYGSSASPNATTPSEDIWKKFDEDLVDVSCFPTPPLSPTHPSSDGEDSGGGGGCLGSLAMSNSFTEKLLRVSELLDDEPAWMTQSFAFAAPEKQPPTPTTSTTIVKTPNPASLLSSKSNYLIQDCMWSAIQAEERRRQMQAEKAAKKQCHGGSLAAIAQTGDFSSGDCVDPTSVFPYPLSETRLNLDLTANTPSDSEEEIDVVTVEKKCQPSSQNVPRTIIIKRHSKMSRKQSTQVIKVLKRCSSNKSILTKVPMKKLKTQASLEEVKRMLQNSITSTKTRAPYGSRGSSRNSSRGSSRSESQVSSDSEDCDRRANHNVLERRRREDLRTSFFRLRDEIPELQLQERAAKIVILKKAMDYVHELHAEEDVLVRQHDAMKRRHKALLQRLRQLESLK